MYLSDAPGEALKLYVKNPTAAQAVKLAALARLATPELLAVSAWPTDTVHRGSALAGLCMPLLPPGSRPLHDLMGPASRRAHFPAAERIGLSALIHAAASLAHAVAVIHRHGHVIADFNSTNVHVSPEGTVILIDVDSFGITEGDTVYPCLVGVPEYTAPELQGGSFLGAQRGPAQDNFALAVFIFQLLFDGRHPFAGRWTTPDTQDPPPLGAAIERRLYAYARRPAPQLGPPLQARDVGTLPNDTVRLFEAAFTGPTWGRPTAADWQRHLLHLNAALHPCPAGHPHFPPRPCATCSQPAPAAGRDDGAPLQRRAADLSARLASLTLHVPLDETHPRVQQTPRVHPGVIRAASLAACVLLPGLTFGLLNLPLPAPWPDALTLTIPSLLGTAGYVAVKRAETPKDPPGSGPYRQLLLHARAWQREHAELHADVEQLRTALTGRATAALTGAGGQLLALQERHDRLVLRKATLEPALLINVPRP